MFDIKKRTILAILTYTAFFMAAPAYSAPQLPVIPTGITYDIIGEQFVVPACNKTSFDKGLASFRVIVKKYSCNSMYIGSTDITVSDHIAILYDDTRVKLTVKEYLEGNGFDSAVVTANSLLPVGTLWYINPKKLAKAKK